MEAHVTACQMSFSCQHSLSPLPSPPCLPSLSPIPYTQTNMTNKQHNTNQTCLPKNTSVRATNSLCPYFQIFDRIFLRMHHQSVKTKVTFSIIHFVRTVRELIFSILQTHYTQMTILFTSAKVVLDRRPQNTFSKKKMHWVCCFRWSQHVLSRTFVVWSETVSLVSWILPPLHRFRAATYHRQL